LYDCIDGIIIDNFSSVATAVGGGQYPATSRRWSRRIIGSGTVAIRHLLSVLISLHLFQHSEEPIRNSQRRDAVTGPGRSGDDAALGVPIEQ
jgi:hypothetical protein